MGEGEIDFKRCINVLKDGGYNGWVMLEEETGAEQEDTSEVIEELGDYVRKNIYPIVKGEY